MRGVFGMVQCVCADWGGVCSPGVRSWKGPVVVCSGERDAPSRSLM
jgi:hypothetical protein